MTHLTLMIETRLGNKLRSIPDFRNFQRICQVSTVLMDVEGEYEAHHMEVNPNGSPLGFLAVSRNLKCGTLPHFMPRHQINVSIL